MNAVSQVSAVLAGILHVGFFALESLLFRRPAVRRLFGGRDGMSADVDLWAYNQGFYNLFLAAGAIGGVIAVQVGHPGPGRAVALFACACMLGAGLVLMSTRRGLWRGALLQAVPPLIALIFR